MPRVIEWRGKRDEIGYLVVALHDLVYALPGRCRFKYMAEMYSASPDGRWVASGSHIYSTRTRQPVYKLPFISPFHTFIYRGKYLCLLSLNRKRLYVWKEWKTHASKHELQTKK